MSVGYLIDKQRIDAQSGDYIYQLRESLARVSRFKTVLDGITDPELEAMGYSAPEVALLKSAFTDLAKLVTIANGTAVQATTYDFFVFAKRLTGLS